MVTGLISRSYGGFMGIRRSLIVLVAVLLCLGLLASCGGTNKKEAEQALKALNLWEPANYISWDKRSEESGDYIFTNVEVKNIDFPDLVFKADFLTVKAPHMEKDQPVVDQFSFKNLKYYMNDKQVFSSDSFWLDKPNALMSKAFVEPFSSGKMELFGGNSQSSDYAFAEKGMKAIKISLQKDMIEEGMRLFKEEIFPDGEDLLFDDMSKLFESIDVSLDQYLAKNSKGGRVESLELNGFSITIPLQIEKKNVNIAFSLEKAITKNIFSDFYDFSDKEAFFHSLLSGPFKIIQDLASKPENAKLPYESYVLKNMNISLSGLGAIHIEQMEGGNALEKSRLRQSGSMKNLKVIPDTNSKEGIAFQIGLKALGYEELVFNSNWAVSYDGAHGGYALDTFNIEFKDGFSLNLNLLLTGLDYEALERLIQDVPENEHVALDIFMKLIEKAKIGKAQLVYEDKSLLEKLLKRATLFIGPEGFTDEAMKSALDGVAEDIKPDIVGVLGEDNFDSILTSLKTFIDNKKSLKITFKAEPPLAFDALETAFKEKKAVLSVEAGENPEKKD